MKSERDVLLLLEFSYCSKSQNLLAISVGRIESIAFQGRGTTGQNHTVLCIRQTRNLTFWYIWMKNDGICPGKIEYGCKFHCQKMTWFRSSRVAKFYRLAWYSLGKLTPILMRSAASTIFRRIILNVCGGGPPVKWERKQKIKTQKKQEEKKMREKSCGLRRKFSVILLFSTISSKWWLYIDIFMKKEVLPPAVYHTVQK